MRTLQEKYNGINEGKFTKDQFLRDARMEQPSLVTQYNGYDDAVQILKNRGMIQEAKKETVKEWSPYGSMAFSGEREQEKEKAPLSSLEVGDLVYVKGVSGDYVVVKDKKEDGTVGVGHPHNDRISYQDGNKEAEVIKRASLKEARLTNKSLTDYRYKPTNDMDKYPYEQILRGLRVELEGLNILGTPTPEEYKKALAKVLKNLEKDTIFYTNQVAGVSKKVDLHDKMVDVKKDNAVDKFNGLKKAQLKEAIKGVIKNILSENSDPDLYGQAKKRDGRRFVYNDQGDFGLESEFGDSFDNLDPDFEGGIDEDIYEMQGPKTDAEYKAELIKYLKDNQIYGHTDMLFDILTDPNEETVGDKLWSFLEDYEKVEHYKNLMAIFRDYANDNENQYIPDGDDEEDFDDLFEGNKSEKELRAEWEKYQATCHPEDRIDYWDWRSGKGLDEAIDTEADKNMVRKFMTMYETEPSKFEKLHKQAQTQASTTKDIKFKHLLSLLNRAKAGALQSLANQDRFEADREGMDESISLKDIL